MAGKVEIDLILKGEQAQAEAAKVDQSLDNIGKAGQSGTNQAKAGLNNLEKAARDTKSQIAAFDREILQSRAQLAQLAQQLVEVNTRFGRSSTEAQALKGQMAQVGAATRGLVAEKALLVAESKAEEAATLASTSAWSRKTSMLNTGQGAFRGMDAAIQGVLRSMGGINLGLAVGIGLLGAMIPLIVDLVSAKGKVITVDEEQIKSDLARADSGERVIRSQATLTASFRVLVNEQKQYRASTAGLERALDSLNTTGVEMEQIFGPEGGPLAAVHGAEALREKITELNESLGEQDKRMAPAIAILVTYRDAMGLTTEEVVQLAASTKRFSQDDLPFLREQLADTIPFAEQLGAAFRKLSVPEFNVGATAEGVVNQSEGVLKAIFAAGERGLKGDDLTRAIGPTVKPLIASLKQMSSSVAEYHQRIRDLTPAVEDQVRATIRLDEANKRAFATEKKGADLLALDKELRAAQIKSRTADLAKVFGADKAALAEQYDLIRLNYEFRRKELIKNGQMTEAINDKLHQTEMAELDANLKQGFALEEKHRNERHRAIEQEWEKVLRLEERSQERMRQLHLEHQRKVRVIAQTEFESDFANRSNRAGRRAMEDDAIGTNREAAEALREVQDAFGFAAQSAALYQVQLDLAKGKSVSFGQVTKAVFAELVTELVKSGQVFQMFGNLVGDVFENIITKQRSAKAILLGFVAEILTFFGQMALAVGGIFLFIPGHQGLGVGLIAAGLAAMALAGVFRGLASNAQAAADAKRNAGTESGSAGATAGASGGGQPRGPTVIPFPTSGRSGQAVTLVITPDSQTWSKLLKDGGVLTVDNARGSKSPQVMKLLKSFA